MILNAPWYVRNDDIRETLGVPSVEPTIEIINERHWKRINSRDNRTM